MNASTDLLTSLRNTWDQIVAVVPRLTAALALLVLGWLVAKVARRAAVRILRLLRVDDLAERAGLDGFLVQGGVPYTTVTILAAILYWGILFVTFVAFLNVVGLPSATQLLDEVVLFVPHIVLAIVILLFGALLARLVGTVAYTYLNNIGSTGAVPLAALARYAMLLFVVALAAEQLALNSEVLLSGFRIAFGALCLALALAFGLGGRHWASRVLDRLWSPERTP